jgi:hypothetical protein
MQSQATLVTDQKCSRLITTYSNHTSLESTFQVSQLHIFAYKFFISIGYGGYVPSVKSENCFGLTYGKTSYLSNSEAIPKGMDLPGYIKYSTTNNNDYIDHNKRIHLVETTA